MALRLAAQSRAVFGCSARVTPLRLSAIAAGRFAAPLHTTTVARQEAATQKVDKLHGSYHWDFERAVAVVLPILVASAAIKGHHPVTDALLGVVLPIHCHLGFDACLVDYLHKRKFPVAGPLAKGALWLATGTVMYGCYRLNTEDIGMTELVMKVWAA